LLEDRDSPLASEMTDEERDAALAELAALCTGMRWLLVQQWELIEVLAAPSGISPILGAKARIEELKRQGEERALTEAPPPHFDQQYRGLELALQILEQRESPD
jgi:hypothetical protein